MYLVVISILIMIMAIVIMAHNHPVIGLLQVAGPINVTIGIGHSADFKWIILPDKGKSANVTVSADGNGSQFLSFPLTLQLLEGKITPVPVKVTIPSNFSDGQILTPKIRATEAGKESKEGSIVNIEVVKNITLHITNSSILTRQNQTSDLSFINSTQ